MPNEPFSQLATNLKEACDQQDWVKLKLLDQQINVDIRAALQSATSEQEKKLLASHLKSVQKIYNLMIEQGTNYRDDISAELLKLNKDKKAVNLYLDSSGYFG